MAIWRSPSTEGLSPACVYLSVGQDRLILTCFSIVQEHRILSRWRSGDRHLQRGVVVCRAGSGDPARLSVGQDRLILTCSGAGAPELQSGKSARSCPDGDQAIAIYRVCPLCALTLARDRPSPYVKRWRFTGARGCVPRAFFLRPGEGLALVPNVPERQKREN